MHTRLVFLQFSFLMLLAACTENRTPLEYVDPFIGTGFHGHTYPGATAPYGAVQLSPDTRKYDWDACAGYHYSDNTLFGFSHTHLSGTGCIDLGDVLFRPAVQTPLSFSHAEEEASPGYYKVYLPEPGVTAELTATTRTGVHRYTYPKGKKAELVIDMGHLLENETIHEAWLDQTSEHEVVGMRCTSGWVENQYVYFVARFSEPVEKIAKVTEQEAHLVFDTKGSPLICKVGISIVSIENARLNLETETGDAGFDFDRIHARTRTEWEKELSVITIEGGTEADRKNFYTAIYHTKVVPNVITDVNGQYRNHHQQMVAGMKGSPQYSTFSIWDTFRAWNPLMTLLNTDLVNQMIQSYLDIYDTTGELPLWPLSSGETFTMIGYHTASIIADAYQKGIRGYDVEKALEAMKASAEKNKKGADDYIRDGFIPADSKKESVSCLLEFAYDDWCIAQMAKAMGREEDYNTFIERSQNYINVFDGSTGFFRGKRGDGNWETPFNIYAIGRSYTEANPWQYRFFVPHDVHGMIQQYGGMERFHTALDAIFSDTTEIEGDLDDVTGLIGQYAHGNEPSHHIPYLFNYTGQSWKTQEWTRRILREMYQPTPEGIIGNEDCGQMSAWYILSSLGFYAVCPGTGEFMLTTPLFDKATVRLANGNTLEIKANSPDRNTYIEKVTINGKEINRPFITYDELMEGGLLEYTLRNTPAREWGTGPSQQPYSYSEGLIVSIPYIENDLGLFEGETHAVIGCATEGVTIHYTLDGTDPTEQSPVYTEPIRITGTTPLKARAFRNGYKPSRICSLIATKAIYRPAQQINLSENGVRYTYYEGQFQEVADMKKAKVAATGVLPEPSIAGALQEDFFGFIFEGYIYVPVTGVYEFSTRSDDGSVLFINGEKVVDNDTSHAAIDAFGRIPLEKGYHPYALHYFEDYEGEYLSWSWRLPGKSTFEAIPAGNLFIR